MHQCMRATECLRPLKDLMHQNIISLPNLHPSLTTNSKQHGTNYYRTALLKEESLHEDCSNIKNAKIKEQNEKDRFLRAIA